MIFFFFLGDFSTKDDLDCSLLRPLGPCLPSAPVRDTLLKCLKETDQTRYVTFSTCSFGAVDSRPLRGNKARSKCMCLHKH